MANGVGVVHDKCLHPYFLPTILPKIVISKTCFLFEMIFLTFNVFPFHLEICLGTIFKSYVLEIIIIIIYKT
jgi:hypothetical protein